METYNSGMARSACVYSAELAMESAKEAVVLSDQTACPYDPVNDYDQWSQDACCKLNVTVSCIFENFYFQLYFNISFRLSHVVFLINWRRRCHNTQMRMTM